MTLPASTSSSTARERAAEHGTLTAYAIGFLLSIALSVLPFLLVEIHVRSNHFTFSHPLLLGIIVLCGVAQLIAQLVFFFHVWGGEGGRWNSIAFAFMALFVGIIVIGSLWIMYNLSVRVMPQTEPQMNAYMNSQDGM